MTKTLAKILYAEDDADIRTIAQIALEDLGGFSVKYCLNGKEAVELAKEFQPDLFLLDVMMPEMDGPTALNELRKHAEFIATPAIFMTAKIQTDELIQYEAMGVLGVINKPFDPMQLAQIVRNFWDTHYG